MQDKLVQDKLKLMHDLGNRLRPYMTPALRDELITQTGRFASGNYTFQEIQTRIIISLANQVKFLLEQAPNPQAFDLIEKE